MQRLRKFLAAAVLTPVTIISLSGFGMPGIGNIIQQSAISEHVQTLSDLGLGFLEPGHLGMIVDSDGFGTIVGASGEVIRRVASGSDADSFYNEYWDVAYKDPVRYNQIGKSDIDRLWRDGSRVTAGAAFGRKLVSQVTANLIKMNQNAALGADLSQSEQDVKSDDDTQGAARDKILAKLKEKKAHLDAKQRQVVARMTLAALGAALCATHAAAALPKAVEAIPGAGRELVNLPNDFANNPLDAAKVPAIIDGTKNMITNIQRLAKDLPAFIKNTNVLFAALSELSSGGDS